MNIGKRHIGALTRKGTLLGVVAGLVGILAAGCGSGGGTAAQGQSAQKAPISFIDYSWSSAPLQNRIAAFIIQNGYGYPTKFTFANTLPGFEGLEKGTEDVSMETWTADITSAYQKAVKAGTVVSLGYIYASAPQGWYVPTYVIKGDPSRGIKPMAPGLTSVADLAKYWKVFSDPQNPGKGVFYNCPSGWVCSQINAQKLKSYGLDGKYVAKDTGSGTALAAAVLSAYQRGKPILFYYWEPTSLLGQIKATQLKEPAYSKQCWNTTKACAYPESPVLVTVNSKLVKRAPKVVAFLKKYQVTLADTQAALSQEKTNHLSPEQAAVWFLNNKKSVWEQWVPQSVAQKVLAALKKVS